MLKLYLKKFSQWSVTISPESGKFKRCGGQVQISFFGHNFVKKKKYFRTYSYKILSSVTVVY